MAAFLFQIFINILVCASYQKICDESNECDYITFNCPSFQLCTVICSGIINACSHMTINCPSGNQCTLQCSGTQNACNGVTLNCNSGTCGITCSGSNSACNGAIINGNNSPGLTVDCSQSNACEATTIHCSDSDSQCYVNCHAQSACKMATIYGASNRNLQVNCENDQACDRVIIDASMTNSFELSDCRTGTSTCRGITVHCPPNDAGNQLCTINGDGGLFGTSTYPLTFYATNGFADINFITPFKTDNDYYGTMHCDLNYTSSCNISTDGWFCDSNGNTRCNDPQPTISPTINPTYIPTIYPTYIPSINPTMEPSINPSFSPITSIPTYMPTYNPTTPNPTVYPTSLQPTTLQPTTTQPTTIYPTKIEPSNIPTLSPVITATQPTIYVSDKPTRSPVLTTDEPTQQSEYWTTYEIDKSMEKKDNKLQSFTLFLVMILSMIILCCLFIVCCLKQLRKDKIRHAAFAVEIELNKTNAATNRKPKERASTFIDNGENDNKPPKVHGKLPSVTNTLWSDSEKVYQSEIYKSNDIMIENDDEVINEDSENYVNSYGITPGINGTNANKKQTNGNDNICNDDMIIEGDDDGNITPSDLIIYKDDTDSDKGITKGQNDDTDSDIHVTIGNVKHNNQNQNNHEYIIESDNSDDDDFNRHRLQTDGETGW